VAESDENNNDRIVSVMTSLDSDGDGLLDGEELHLGTNPYLCDTDGDGIPDGWELAHGLNPNDLADGSADSDADGMSNLQEYLVGTDPINSTSVFRILSIVPTGNDVRVTWQTGGGRTNALQAVSGAYSTNFADIGGTLIVSGSGDVITNRVDTGGATNGPSRFYRIRLVP